MWPRRDRGGASSRRVSWSGNRGEGVLDEHLERGREPVAGPDVEPGYRVAGVGGAVAVGDRAIRVAVRVAVGVRAAGVVAVGLARWLDPDVGVQVAERG